MTALIRSLCAVVLTCSVAAVLHAADHPRLFFSASDIASLRTRIQSEPFKSMHTRLQADAEVAVYNEAVKYETPLNPDGSKTADSQRYDSAYRASKCAFLYVLSSSATTGEDWARKARNYTIKVITEGAWSSTSARVLTMAMHLKHAAHAYDFCYNSQAWKDVYVDPATGTASPFRDWVSLKIQEQARFLSRVQSGEIGSTVSGYSSARKPGGNIFAVTAGAVGLGLLATDHDPEGENAARLTECWNDIMTHIDVGLGTSTADSGWAHEGIGYAIYPWTFVGPYGIAQLRQDPTRNLKTSRPLVAKNIVTIFTGLTKAQTVPLANPANTISRGAKLDFIHDSNVMTGEGIFGLAFYYAENDDIRKAMRWTYDQFKGTGGDRSWDNDRAGTIYSILYYPTSPAAADPDGIPAWKAGFLVTSGHGYSIFRNKHQDHNDIVLGLNCRFKEPPYSLTGTTTSDTVDINGHWTPDIGGFRILGMGGSLAVGGGRQDNKDIPVPERTLNQRSMNILYASDPSLPATDPGGFTPVEMTKLYGKRIGTLVGNPLMNSTDGSGRISCFSPLTPVGVTNFTRRWLTDFSTSSGASAVFVVADTSDNGIFWQYSALKKSAAVTVSGNTFTVPAPNGSLQGTIVYPAGATVEQWVQMRGTENTESGVSYPDNTNLKVRSNDGDFLVVMTVVPTGTAHPTVSSISGLGVDGRSLTVGGLGLRVDGNDITTLPVVSVSAYDATAAEPGATINNGTFRFSRTGPTAASMTLSYQVETVANGAVSGTDYTALSGTVTIAAGKTYADVTVVPKTDAVDESGEVVTVQLMPSSAHLIQANGNLATVSIQDADYGQPSVSIIASDSTASEPNGGTAGTGKFKFTRTNSQHQTLSVEYSLAFGTTTSQAQLADIRAVTGSVTIPINAASAEVTITPVSDALDEESEVLSCSVRAPADARYIALASVATMTIADATYGTPVLTASVSDSTASEANGTTVIGTGKLRISRTGSLHAPLDVFFDFPVDPLKATVGIDFQWPLGSSVKMATIPANAYYVDLTITPINDTLDEEHEQATMIITPGAGYTVGSVSTASLTITDATYGIPTVSLTVVDGTAGEPNQGSGTGSFRLVRTGSLGAPLTITLSTSGSTASTDDYTLSSLTIPKDASSLTVTLTPLADALVESQEAAQVTLVGVSGSYAASSTQNTVTIVINNK
jgi:hypothetical protein